MDDEYYTEDEVFELVDDMDQFREFINGWRDAVKFDNAKLGPQYKRKYVDLWLTRRTLAAIDTEEK